MTALVDAGGGAGYIKYYDVSNNVLATQPFGATAFGNAAAGVCTKNAISNVTVAASGTVTYFKFFNFADTLIATGTVGTTGANMNFNVVVWLLGATVEVSTLTWTQASTSTQ
jgi:hypothetical protein